MPSIPKTPRINDPKLRAGIKQEANGRCSYCKERAKVQVHHIKSRGAGGGDTKDNLIALCAECHAKAHSDEIDKAELRAIAARR